VKSLAIVAALIAAVWLWTTVQRHRTEHQLGTIASQLAGRQVGVRCQGFWAAMLDINDRKGEVDFPQGRAPDHMFLTRDVCGRLRHFGAGKARKELDCLAAIDWTRWSADASYNAPCESHARADVEAINTLAHEAMHLRGFTGEAQAQCYAIQEDAWTVVRLGGTVAQGAAAAAFVLALQALLPSEYQSGECRSRGGLDLWPATPGFPTEAAPELPPTSLVGSAV
jgi:hypothetical protein